MWRSCEGHALTSLDGAYSGLERELLMEKLRHMSLQGHRGQIGQYIGQIGQHEGHIGQHEGHIGQYIGQIG